MKIIWPRKLPAKEYGPGAWAMAFGDSLSIGFVRYKNKLPFWQTHTLNIYGCTRWYILHLFGEWYLNVSIWK
jgi:hypothetical protein